jgi:hypothetical protein
MGKQCECGCGKATAGPSSRFCRGHNLNANRPAAERLWAQVKKGDGCWEWTSPTMVKGYGLLRVSPQKKELAHRFSYELHCGPIPDGAFVLHKCDNRKCVRPDHLFLGDQDANMKDMAEKGRAADNRGEKNPNAKLTAADVAEVKRMRTEGHKRQVVADRFKITTTMVTLITSGKAWNS